MKQNLFNSIKLTRPKSNMFDLSHDFKFSANMGELIPICCQEAIPGDRWNISNETLVRFAPLVAPIMHRVDVTVHYFFVPYRILWKAGQFEKWITGNTKDGQEPATWPYLMAKTANYTRLMDLMGIPTPIGSNEEKISAMPFIAYQKIWYDYYRDQNMYATTPDPTDSFFSGNNTNEASLYVLRNRSWEHDYFTSALPTAQQGSEVAIPLGTVELNPDWAAEPGHPHWKEGGGSLATNGDLQAATVLPGGAAVVSSNDTGDPLAYDPAGSLEVQPTTINDLRRATRLQEWLEKAMRAGARYTENILAFFGVRSSDARLQRPEYITGSKTPVRISEVLNTTGTEDAPQGQMSGHGLAVVNPKSGSYFCEEHGLVIGIMSVMPKTAYQQGLEKFWLKYNDQFDYYWPPFANIGEQEILNREVYAFQGTDGDNTFGYIPRYAEYKYANNRVAGDFRTSLDFWHMGRKFASPPSLNAAFVTADPTHRVFAVTDPDEQKLWIHCYNKMYVRRLMPKFGTPTF